MITRIDATNYRCFEDLGITFGEFAVIAGANGSGKTTLLDIPLLIGDLLRSRNVAHAFLGRILGRGARATSLSELTYRSERNSFTLGIEALLPDEIQRQLVDAATVSIRETPERHPTHIRYELRLEVKDAHQLIVRNESLFVYPASEDYENERLPIQGENSASKNWRFILEREVLRESETDAAILSAEIVAKKVDPRYRRVDVDRAPRELRAEVDLTITALPLLQYQSEADFPAGRWFFNLLMSGALFFDPKWPELRRAAPPGLERTLMASGENLPWLAQSLKNSDPERFDWWVSHVQTALTQIANIEVIEREEDHHAYFRVTYEGGFAVTSSGLSEGTLRIMALTLVAYLQNAPALVVIEEPENSIHPQAIAAIMDSLRSLYDQQVWLSTHSPVVLADSQLFELIITRLDRSGAASVVRGEEHHRLVDWKGAIDLGSLFATGVFE